MSFDWIIDRLVAAESIVHEEESESDRITKLQVEASHRHIRACRDRDYWKQRLIEEIQADQSL